MKSYRRRSDRAGMTMLELLIAVTLALAIFAAAVPFFRVQTRSVSAHAGRSDAQQNARYAVSTIDRELRVAGVGVVNRQPMLVQADPYAITFNVDLMTRDPADPGAVYYDQDVAINSTLVLPVSNQITLPRGAVRYPDSTYMAAGGVPSKAETISFWAALDSSTARTDDYILFRRVNDAVPNLVAKGIILPVGEPMFRYFKTDSIGRPTQILQSTLPMYHSTPVHGSVADTGKSALTDSVRIVRMRVSTVFKDPDKGDVLRSIESNVRLLNAGLIHNATCGDVPLGTAINAAVNLGPPITVSLTWTASLDQTAGEKDVERYAIYRRDGGNPVWGEPYISFPANLINYTFQDPAVASGEIWEYGIVAQDCTPANSSLSVSGPVVIP